MPEFVKTIGYSVGNDVDLNPLETTRHKALELAVELEVCKRIRQNGGHPVLLDGHHTVAPVLESDQEITFIDYAQHLRYLIRVLMPNSAPQDLDEMPLHRLISLVPPTSPIFPDLYMPGLDGYSDGRNWLSGGFDLEKIFAHPGQLFHQSTERLRNLGDTSFVPEQEIAGVENQLQLNSVIEASINSSMLSLSNKEWGYIFLCLLSGLDFFHALELVHGDVKPANIMINRGDVYHICFSLPKFSNINDFNSHLREKTDSVGVKIVDYGSTRTKYEKKRNGKPVEYMGMVGIVPEKDDLEEAEMAYFASSTTSQYLRGLRKASNSGELNVNDDIFALLKTMIEIRTGVFFHTYNINKRPQLLEMLKFANLDEGLVDNLLDLFDHLEYIGHDKAKDVPDPHLQDQLVASLLKLINEN